MSRAASPLPQGTYSPVPRTRIPLNCNDRPAQARNYLKYAGGGTTGAQLQSGKLLIAGEIEVSEECDRARTAALSVRQFPFFVEIIRHQDFALNLPVYGLAQVQNRIVPKAREE